MELKKNFFLDKRQHKAKMQKKKVIKKEKYLDKKLKITVSTYRYHLVHYNNVEYKKMHSFQKCSRHNGDHL